MTTRQILHGQQMALDRLSALKAHLAQRLATGLRTPGLCTVLVGNDPASHIYVSNKRKKALEIGIKSIHHGLPISTSEQELLLLVKSLNEDEHIDAILVQVSLPVHIREAVIIEAIDPDKDVDGFHPLNLGYLFRGTPRIIPCTPKGCLYILEQANTNFRGKHAVVVGRSSGVGNPMAQLLLRKDATITMTHRHTENLAEITKQADILVVAVGKAKLITKAHVKKGATVVDVGINRDEQGKLCGDVDFDEVKYMVSAITPVPRGVGPMTIAMLLENTLELWQRRI